MANTKSQSGLVKYSGVATGEEGFGVNQEGNHDQSKIGTKEHYSSRGSSSKWSV